MSAINSIRMASIWPYGIEDASVSGDVTNLGRIHEARYFDLPLGGKEKCQFKIRYLHSQQAGG